MFAKGEVISVIVPIYNVENYLHTCIESILNQTYQQLEIILVDDGSTDSCSKICDEYQAMYPEKIVVIHKTNGGLSDARNVGISRANGKYIALVDADDYICPDMLQVLLEAILEHNADLSACEYAFVSEDNEFPKCSSKMEQTIVSGDELMHRIYTATGSKIDFVAWNKLYKKQIFDNSGIIYPVGKCHEDEYTTHKLLHECNKVVVVNQKLYCYRFRESSIAHTPNSHKLFDYMQALEETMLDFKENNILDVYALFRYMAALYSIRKLYGLRTRERFLINKKLVQYRGLVLKQKKLSFKRKWGLVVVSIIARIELITMPNKDHVCQEG